MTKPTRITGTYRMNDDEFIQVSVVIDSNYPDAIAELEQQVQRHEPWVLNV